MVKKKNISKKDIKTKTEEPTHTKNIIILICISIIVKVCIFFGTPNIIHSFIDTWDYRFYYDNLITPFIAQGNLPYINYNWEYPVLMLIPVLIASVPSILFNNETIFFTIFPILMIIFDIITIMCVYFITLKIYNNPQRSFIAALLFATAFSAAYFVITKYDAFPTCLMMVGIALTIYGGDKLKSYGYTSIILDFFTKIYPAIILPFVILFNSKSTSLKQEIISLFKIFIPASIILAIPILILNPSAINVYLLQTEMNKDISVNTFTYTIYAWIHDVFGIGISFSTISTFMYVITGIFLLTLCYIAYSYPEKSPILLLELILCALFIVVTLSRFHSPQYVMWFTPIICIFMSDDIKKIGLFYLSQIILFIEFPIAWGGLYTNSTYAKQLPSVGGQIALVFFTIEYIVLFYLLFVSTNNKLIPFLKERIKLIYPKTQIFNTPQEP